MTSSSSTPAPPEALTPPTHMAEDDGYSDDFESNLLTSRNLQKHEALRKNDVKFVRNTACTETHLWARSSERREVLETGRRYEIGGQLQQGDEDTTLFHESITIFLTMYLGVGQSNDVLWSDHKDGKTPTNSLAL